MEVILKHFALKFVWAGLFVGFFFSKDMNMQVTESVEENYVLVLLEFSV